MGKLCRCNPCGARRTGPGGGPGAGGWGPGGVVGTFLEIKKPGAWGGSRSKLREFFHPSSDGKKNMMDGKKVRVDGNKIGLDGKMFDGKKSRVDGKKW